MYLTKQRKKAAPSEACDLAKLAVQIEHPTARAPHATLLQ
jgi:hypothetical protein